VAPSSSCTTGWPAAIGPVQVRQRGGGDFDRAIQRATLAMMPENRVR
jgi:hypothetical protein